MVGQGSAGNVPQATAPRLDYYAILGVAADAGDDAIHAAYKALSDQYDPDRFTGSPDEAHRRMAELMAAYAVLTDPLRRGRYDFRQRIHASARALPPSGDAPPDDSRPPLRVVTRIPVAPSPRRKLALGYGLLGMIAIIVGSNVYQYRTRSEEAPTQSASSPTSESAPSMASPGPSATPSEGTSPPAASVHWKSSAASRASPTTPSGALTAPATDPTASTKTPAGPMPSPREPRSSANVAPQSPPEARSAEAQGVSRATVAPLSARASTPRSARLEPAPKPARTPQDARSAESAAPAAASDRCTDTMAALGLCKPIQPPGTNR